MKYVRLPGIEDNELYYFEVDDRNVAYRQIVVTDNYHYAISTAPDFQLSEIEIEYADDELIGEAEFQKIWDLALEPYREEWNHTKRKYSLGQEINGVIQMFYPQGIIIRGNDNVYAVTDYEAVKRQIKPEYLNPGYKISGVIKDYDDKNFWFVLEDCSMTGDRIS
ncbi:hypothetical protein [Brevibacillus laterosporus]|uniref:S1 motif domain-containing protein n=1 Tax=Brevibacillus laterosporus TaxID=1465 RepID=A0AAP3GD66_BRELA|nr:hypothetical protein [Brevibacillus laterosporus]MCR8980144.1 hypothetical protein [Brevibacillus laterosporus]MCZ0807299.1 hypothetical protein [Brevibacillus laterosporus]MCZ0825592.1 hypothetical protein [Brevibacillus laterosporus]MCZ0849370.1 hypothetical protein [Brevibacillus laterosporus]